MAAISGALSKAAFRIEGASISGTGMPSADYPITTTNADSEEVQLKDYDQVPLLSEGVTEEHAFEVDETLTGTPAITSSDRVSIMGGGSLSCTGMYDGLTQLIGCAMGFERGDKTAYPQYTGGQALLTGGTMTSNTWLDANYTFTSADIGKWIRIEDNDVGEGQVRRIISVSGSTATISPNWNLIPSQESGSMGVRFNHLFELSDNLADELWTDVYPSYSTVGVGLATDQIIRRGSLGILKQGGAKPWVWRSCHVNSMGISGSSGSGITMDFDLIPFDLDRDSATNSNVDTDSWDWSKSPNVNNQKMMFSDLNYIRIAPYSTSQSMGTSNEYGVSEFSISLNNNLKTDDQSVQSGVYRIEPMRGGAREITGSITLPRYDSDTFIDWRSNDTILMMEIDLEGSQIDGGSTRQMDIFLPSIKITGSSVSVGGADVITQSFDFQAFVPASGQASGFPGASSGLGTKEMYIRLLNEYPFNVFRDQNREY